VAGSSRRTACAGLRTPIVVDVSTTCEIITFKFLNVNQGTAAASVAVTSNDKQWAGVLQALQGQLHSSCTTASWQTVQAV
jgi:hypothetical protein